MQKKKMKNPKYWAEITLRDHIHPDSVHNLDKMSNKYHITKQQKELFRKAAKEYLAKITKII